MSRIAAEEAEAAKMALHRSEVRVSELESQVRHLDLKVQKAESAAHAASSAQQVWFVRCCYATGVTRCVRALTTTQRPECLPDCGEAREVADGPREEAAI